MTIGPLIHDDAHHGPGKRWEGTRYTCTGCRLRERIIAELVGLGDGLHRMALAAAETRAWAEAFAAASDD